MILCEQAIIEESYDAQRAVKPDFHDTFLQTKRRPIGEFAEIQRKSTTS
jgi:hypothetical protein